jgi:hypothetical protein
VKQDSDISHQICRCVYFFIWVSHFILKWFTKQNISHGFDFEFPKNVIQKCVCFQIHNFSNTQNFSSLSDLSFHSGEDYVLVFWVVTPCGLVGRFQRFGETYCPHLQGWSPPKRWYLPTSPHGVTTQENNTHILIYCHFPGGRKQWKTSITVVVFRPWFEPGTSRIRHRNANRSIPIFGVWSSIGVKYAKFMWRKVELTRQVLT